MAVKQCPKCGEDNSEKAVSCAICGCSIKDAEIKGIRNQDKEGYSWESKASKSLREKFGMKIFLGANLFYYVAIMSFINLQLKNGRFVIGLGLINIIKEIGDLVGDAFLMGKLIFFLINLCIIGLFAMFGYQANRQRKFAL